MNILENVRIKQAISISWIEVIIFGLEQLTNKKLD